MDSPGSLQNHVNVHVSRSRSKQNEALESVPQIVRRNKNFNSRARCFISLISICVMMTRYIIMFSYRDASHPSISVDHHIISNNDLIDSDHLEMQSLDAPDEIETRRNMTLFPSPRNHPFAGARDMNGHWGYVADP
eukprot:scaffold135666_cov70-Cyclotella_meneghiniana.AAC.2